MGNTINLELCAGRHPIPNVDGSIFPTSIEDPTNINAMWRIVCGNLGSRDFDTLNLYVTGLTVCLGEVIRWCFVNHRALVLYHYDRVSGEYYHQMVFSEQDMLRLDEAEY